MHEYSVASELVSALLEKLAEHPGKVSKVFVQKGELRILSDPARISCSSCGYEGVAEYAENASFHFAVPILSCPRCESAVTVLAGRELSVDRVTLETEDDDG